MRRREGKIALCSLNSYVKEIFEVSGFSAMIPIKDSIEEGLKDLS
jgi:anti-anti-sigma regulatory factor